eukprot:scaffold30.g4448.t1
MAVRRSLLPLARLLSRELATEVAAAGGCPTRQLASVAARAAAPGVARALAPVAANSATPAPSQLAQARSYADDAFAFNTILYPEPELEVGGPAPDFKLPAIVDGEIRDVSLADYKGNREPLSTSAPDHLRTEPLAILPRASNDIRYVILFWYPKDFTFVCPTEIIAFSDRAKEFEALNCQIPILADVTKEVAARYGVLKRDVGIALRGLYIVNPQVPPGAFRRPGGMWHALLARASPGGRHAPRRMRLGPGVVEHVTINNFPVGRNVDEALRVLQAVQYVAEHGEVCPAGWKPGDRTMVADPEKSLEYFGGVAEQEKEAESGAKLAKVSSRKDYDDLVASGKKVVVKFWAPWCNKCRMIGPLVDELQDKYPGVTIASFDTTEEKLENVAAELGVKGLPAFKFYAGGKEVLDRIVGYKKAPLVEALEALNKL